VNIDIIIEITNHYAVVGNAIVPVVPHQLHSHVKHAKAYDPGEIPSTLPSRFQDVAFWSVKTIGFAIGYFGAQHLQLLLSACLLLHLRLKKPVARFPPRLSTGGWLSLSRRDSHPLYV